MMTPEEIEVAKRLSAHEEWTWAPGMRWVVLLSDTVIRSGVVVCPTARRSPHALPDISDPATKGALLAMVRERRNDKTFPHAAYSEYRGCWVVWDMAKAVATGPSEGIALAEAWLTAPSKDGTVDVLIDLDEKPDEPKLPGKMTTHMAG